MGLLNNVKWVSYSQIIKVASQLLGMVVFSRYLTPREIGLMSMTLIVVNLANIFRDLGSSAAIIQRENLTDSLKCSVFYLNLALGLFLFILGISFSGVVSSFFNEPEISWMIKFISIAFPINSITAIHLALLERESKFNKTAKVEIFSSLISLGVAVFFATHGAGVYSLVIQTLLYSIISAIGFWMGSGWMPSTKFRLHDIKSIFSFSSNLVAFNFINYFSRNADQIIAGRFFNATILGQYSLAYRIMLFPIQNITFVLTRSLYPILSRMQHNYTESADIYLKTLKTIAIIIPPLMMGLAVVSYDFVIVVFGPQWTPIVDMIIWLAPIAIMQSMVSTTGSVFMSHGKTNTLLYISIYNAILQIASFVVGGIYSIDVLIKLYLIANIFMFIPNMALAMKILRGGFFDVLCTIIRPLLAAVFMSVFVIYFKRTFLGAEFNPFFSLTICVLLGIVSYSVVLILIEWKYITGMIRSKKKNLSE